MGYKHGKFAFPYGRIIGYRKGADGKPEIIPEQAEIIRLIFNSYLQGDGLQSIKAKLETAGALTTRGNTAWSAQSIQRILQNREKYCGDVLLQKRPFTEDVLTGVHKKNTGQLRNITLKITTRALSANRCSERCKLRSPAETASQPQTSASAAVAATTASMPCRATVLR